MHKPYDATESYKYVFVGTMTYKDCNKFLKQIAKRQTKKSPPNHLQEEKKDIPEDLLSKERERDPIHVGKNSSFVILIQPSKSCWEEIC